MKEKQDNLVKIGFIALPFVLGLAVTYASGVLHLGGYEGIRMDFLSNGYGFPLGWLKYSSVDFASFLADFLIWSGIFAPALWLFYYINH